MPYSAATRDTIQRAFDKLSVEFDVDVLQRLREVAELGRLDDPQAVLEIVAPAPAKERTDGD